MKIDTLLNGVGGKGECYDPHWEINLHGSEKRMQGNKTMVIYK